MNFEVMGGVIPGSRLELITRLSRREISRLHCNDFVVILGGALISTEMNPAKV